jgi:hypothetical protein
LWRIDRQWWQWCPRIKLKHRWLQVTVVVMPCTFSSSPLPWLVHGMKIIVSIMLSSSKLMCTIFLIELSKENHQISESKVQYIFLFWETVWHNSEQTSSILW